MTPLAWLDPEEMRVFRAFARTSRALFITFDRELQAAIGMPRTYFEILWLLHEREDRSLRMSDLATLTGSQPSRITHAVTRLEQQGAVVRELCIEDRRGWYAVLTDAGAETLALAAPLYAASIRKHFLEPLSALQQQQLTHIGEVLLAELDSPMFSANVDEAVTAHSS